LHGARKLIDRRRHALQLGDTHLGYGRVDAFFHGTQPRLEALHAAVEPVREAPRCHGDKGRDDEQRRYRGSVQPVARRRRAAQSMHRPDGPGGRSGVWRTLPDEVGDQPVAAGSKNRAVSGLRGESADTGCPRSGHVPHGGRRWRRRSGSSRFEQLDRIAGRVAQQDPLAAEARDDVAAKLHSRAAKRFDFSRKIVDLELDASPSAGLG
jgi:hypothetical protein